MAKKYKQIADLLRTRIHHGDYTLQEIPPERRLAAEVDASYMTVRRAIRQLVDDGFLVRQANGRVAVNPDRSDGVLQLGFLAPSYPSSHARRLRLGVQRATERFGAVVRPVEYVHWDDPIVRDTIEGFDGVFFVPLAEAVPQRLANWLAEGENPVVMIDQNLSARGVPSLVPFSKDSVQMVLDHLESIGHRAVDCLSIQPEDDVISDRIEQWQIWRQMHSAGGRLFNDPVSVLESARAKAREVVSRLIDQRQFTAEALFCTNLGAAIGAVRALTDHRITAGKDVSVCTIDGEGMAHHLVPSITCIEMPDLDPYLATCIEWMARGGENWIGPLLIRPANVSLFVGESTTAPLTKAPVGELAHNGDGQA